LFIICEGMKKKLKTVFYYLNILKIHSNFNCKQISIHQNSEFCFITNTHIPELLKSECRLIKWKMFRVLFVFGKHCFFVGKFGFVFDLNNCYRKASLEEYASSVQYFCLYNDKPFKCVLHRANVILIKRERDF